MDFKETTVENPAHDGSGSPPLIYLLSLKSTSSSNAVADVLNVLNDLLSFNFGSILSHLKADHERLNLLGPQIIEAVPVSPTIRAVVIST